jgi:capsule biosynthesis phosphatase
MRIVIDLDGTICTLKKENESYDQVVLIPGAKDKIDELRNLGHYIIIHTARNMATQRGNLGCVMQNVGKVTLDWLSENEIYFDEIYFGKPNGEIYIDDRALRFENWNDIDGNLLLNLAKKK